LYGWSLPHGGLIFSCLNPFDFAFKERFLFDWERKYTSGFRNSNTPVNFFLKNLHFSSQNNLKIILRRTVLYAQNHTIVSLMLFVSTIIFVAKQHSALFPSQI